MLYGNNRLISVIMPAFNSESFIEESIRSVMNQSYSEWELIVIDDGSTDSTKDIVESLILKDDRIKYIYQKNSGQASARNLGIKHSKGLFVAFIDSDDLWLKDMLEASIIEFDKETQDMLFSNSYVFEEGEDYSDLSKLTHLGIYSKKYEGFNGLQEFIKQNRVSMDGILILKESILKVGGFRSDAWGKAEDYDLWLNMLASGAVLRGWNEKLSIIRKHPASTMATTNISVEVITMFRYFFAKHKEIDPFLFRNEISDWLGLALSLSKTKGEIFSAYNKENLDILKFPINTIGFIYKFRNLLSLKVIKKIFYMYLAHFDRKYNS